MTRFEELIEDAVEISKQHGAKFKEHEEQIFRTLLRQIAMEAAYQVTVKVNETLNNSIIYL